LSAKNAARSRSGLRWWRSAVNRSFFLRLAACRTRSSAWDMLPRFCARRVLRRPAFPSAPALGSTGSAAGFPALFVGFLATMAGSDFSRPCIIGYGSSPSRCGPAADMRPVGREISRFPGKERPCMPGSLTTPGRRGLALTPPLVWPSVTVTTSAPGTIALSRLHGRPARSPADASPGPSRGPTHGSGPMWIATPSSRWTCTTYSLPVSRRTTVGEFRRPSGMGVIHEPVF
jgi:hypothetical protein